MTAASGVLHKEYHEENYARRGGPFHMAQLWVNLPKKHKMAPPRYQALLAEQMGHVDLADDAGSVRVIAGEYQGVLGPAKTFSPIGLFDVRLNAKGNVDFDFPSSWNVGLLVMKGDVNVQGRSARLHDFVTFKNTGERVHIEAEVEAQLLLMSGEPILESIAQYGPFVMNTREEIVQAFDDFSSGKFGHLED